MDTKGLLFPKPKDMNKETKNTRKKQEIEFCIMPESKLYSTKRRWNLKRHEVFYGRKQRKLSIEYGLVIFLTPEMHNMSDKGIHFDKDFDLKVKKIAQRAFMKYYKKNKRDFIEIFGKNYL